MLRQVGIESQAGVGQDVKIDMGNTNFETLVHEHGHLKRTAETRDAQQEMQDCYSFECEHISVKE